MFNFLFVADAIESYRLIRGRIIDTVAEIEKHEQALTEKRSNATREIHFQKIEELEKQLADLRTQASMKSLLILPIVTGVRKMKENFKQERAKSKRDNERFKRGMSTAKQTDAPKYAPGKHNKMFY